MGQAVFNLIGVYNPIVNSSNCLEELKQVLENDFANVYIVGDFNVGILRDNQDTQYMSAYMESLGYTMLCNT